MGEFTSSGELSGVFLANEMSVETSQRAQRYTQETGQLPSLLIVPGNPNDGPSITYMGLKKRKGATLGIKVEVAGVDVPYPEAPGSDSSDYERMASVLYQANQDPARHGIIVQLPLTRSLLNDPLYGDRTDEILAMVTPDKDVDGLGPWSATIPATSTAAEHYIKGHNLLENDPEGLIVLSGLGKLTNKQLLPHLENQGFNVLGFDEHTPEPDRVAALNKARVIISAIGKAGILTSDLFVSDTAPKAVVDIGTFGSSGVLRGDVSDELREFALARGWVMTPKKGGIGPMTVQQLFSNVMDAAEAQAGLTDPIPRETLRMAYTLASTGANRAPNFFEVEQDPWVDPSLL